MQGEDFVNKPPLITLIEPQDGAQITWPDPMIFVADTSDPDGQVDEVRFYVQYKRTGGTSTYGFGDNDGSDGWKSEFTWPEDAGFGEWTVWAEAIDNEGQITVSPSIAITLQGP